MVKYALALTFAIGAAPAFAGTGYAIPEPNTLALLGVAVVGIFVARRTPRPGDPPNDGA